VLPVTLELQVMGGKPVSVAEAEEEVIPPDQIQIVTLQDLEALEALEEELLAVVLLAPVVQRPRVVPEILDPVVLPGLLQLVYLKLFQEDLGAREVLEELEEQGAAAVTLDPHVPVAGALVGQVMVEPIQVRQEL
jgi:hypothetical protein